MTIDNRSRSFGSHQRGGSIAIDNQVKFSHFIILAFSPSPLLQSPAFYSEQ
ncbi:hypothetical protein CKA32_000765 [Geitlerinema sp. FC II]|nr:hypothetical protein CKA32_000765 [Geitlerinema sp. FC II]